MQQQQQNLNLSMDANRESMSAVDCKCMASFDTEDSGGGGTVACVAVQQNLVIAGFNNGTIRAYARDLNNPAGDFDSGEFRCGAPAPVKAVAVAENRVYTAHSDHKIRVWSTRGGPNRRFLKTATLPTAADMVRNAAKFWRTDNYVQTRRHRHRLWLRHFDTVTTVAVCSAEAQQQQLLLLYSASWDRTFKVWRLPDMACTESVTAHDDAVNGLCCASRSDTVYTASADGSVKVWLRQLLRGRGRSCAVAHRLTATLRCFGGAAVNCVALSHDEAGVYCGTSAGNVEWCVGAARKSTLRSHGRSVFCVSVVRCFVCTGSADGTVAVWRRSGHAHERVHRFRAHGGPVRCIIAAAEAEPVPEFPSPGFSSHPCSSSRSWCSSSSSLSSSRSCTGKHVSSTAGDTENVNEKENVGFQLYSAGADRKLKVWWVPAELTV